MKLEHKISNWLNEYLNKSNLDSFVIGISGGIDSAVSSTLCAMTGKKTKVVIMPIYQNPEETNRGVNHCNWLKENFKDIDIIEIDLTDVFDSLKSKIPNQYNTKLSLANTRARLRMTSLYSISGGCNGLVVGTGNKIEDFGVGFFTKYGDGGVDISPIADLMKSEVYQLGISLDIIPEIMQAKPTDGLWEDQRTDEDQLGVSYDELEWAMESNGNNLTERQKHIMSIYDEHRSKNIHKMKPIPIYIKNKS